MMEYVFWAYGREILALVITAIASAVGMFAGMIYRRYVNSQEKVAVADAAVRFVEQCYKAIHGAEKMAKAMEIAAMLCKKRGIPFDIEEMKILAEAALQQFNAAFYTTPAFCAPLDGLMAEPDQSEA